MVSGAPDSCLRPRHIAKLGEKAKAADPCKCPTPKTPPGARQRSPAPLAPCAISSDHEIGKRRPIGHAPQIECNAQATNSEGRRIVADGRPSSTRRSSSARPDPEGLMAGTAILAEGLEIGL